MSQRIHHLQKLGMVRASKRRGTSVLQPQGTEFCEKLPHLRRGPRIQKETWPSQHFASSLVKTWEEDTAKLCLDSWPTGCSDCKLVQVLVYQSERRNCGHWRVIFNSRLPNTWKERKWEKNKFSREESQVKPEIGYRLELERTQDGVTCELTREATILPFFFPFSRHSMLSFKSNFGFYYTYYREIEFQIFSFLSQVTFL